MRVFDLALPPGASGSAGLWLGVHEGRPGLLAERRGLYRIAWEFHADPSRVWLVLAVPEVYAENLEAGVYRTWPGASVKTTADPFDGWLPEAVWAAVPSMHLAYSLATRDASGPILDALSEVGDGRACLQVVVRPAPAEWVTVAQRARADIEAGRTLSQGRPGAGLADGLASILDSAVASVFGETPKAKETGPRLPSLAKCAEAGFAVAVRLGVSGRHRLRLLTSLAAALRQERGEAEWLAVRPLPGVDTAYREAMRRRFPSMGGCVLGLTELAALTCPPGPGRGKMDYATSGATEPASVLLGASGVDQGLPLGTVAWRGATRTVTLPERLTDTLVHPKVVLGSKEAGKTTFGCNLVVEAARLGYGSLFIDKADGAAVAKILAALPASVTQDVVLLDFTDFAWPIALSLSEEVSRIATGHEFSPVAQQVGQAWEHLFVKHFSMASQARSRMVFRKACQAVFERADGTLLEVKRLLADSGFRASWLEGVADRRTRLWWAEFAERSAPERRELTDPILNKLDAWLESDILRRVVAQRPAGLDMRELADRGAIVLANINEHALGPETAALIGTLLVTKLWLGAASRYDIPEDERRPFFLVADEPFGYLAAGAVADMLAKARKYRLCPSFLLHSWAQVRDADSELLRLLQDIRPHLFIGATGVETWRDLKYEVAPLAVEECVALPKYHWVSRLHVGGESVPAFVMRGLPPLTPHPRPVRLDATARHRYARPAREVEDDILAREGLASSHETGGVFRRRSAWDSPTVTGDSSRPSAPSVVLGATNSPGCSARTGHSRRP